MDIGGHNEGLSQKMSFQMLETANEAADESPGLRLLSNSSFTTILPMNAAVSNQMKLRDNQVSP